MTNKILSLDDITQISKMTSTGDSRRNINVAGVPATIASSTVEDCGWYICNRNDLPKPSGPYWNLRDPYAMMFFNLLVQAGAVTPDAR